MINVCEIASIPPKFAANPTYIYRFCVSPILLTSCPILAEQAFRPVPQRVDFLVEQAEKPVPKKLIDNGATFQLEPTFHTLGCHTA